MNGLPYELEEAERKAWDSLSRYKFVMFGYWVGVWVHLNRIADTRHSNPWQGLVKQAKAVRAKEALPKPEISFTVSMEEKRQIEEYCRAKKRWRLSSDLARDALWQLMARNPVYKKRAQKEAKTEGVSDLPRTDQTSVRSTA